MRIVVLLLLLCSVYLLSHITVLQAKSDDDINDECSADMKSVKESLKDIQNSMKILLSESNRQNEDLEMVKDDVSAIKFGLAILQHTTDEQIYTVSKEIKETQDCLEEFRNETEQTLASLSDIQECVETTKNTSEDIIDIFTNPGITRSNPATSCSEILQAVPQSQSGYYWIRGLEDQVFCDMEFQCPATNETEATGWVRVASINVNDTTTFCPPGLTTLTDPLRVCAENTNGAGCVPVALLDTELEYSRVCGRIIGYQDGGTEAFNGNEGIESHYIDGISLTYGQPGSRNHIWSFVVARDETNTNMNLLCPCTNSGVSGSFGVQDFVGSDYFCDTGSSGPNVAGAFFPDDPLWDGDGCGSTNECCTFNNPPWFFKEISPPTTEGIEMRLCTSGSPSDEDVNFEMVDIYVQ